MICHQGFLCYYFRLMVVFENICTSPCLFYIVHFKQRIRSKLWTLMVSFMYFFVVSFCIILCSTLSIFILPGDEQLDRPNGQTSMEICQVVVAYLGFNINTTAFCLGRYSLHLLLLKSSMVLHILLTDVLLLT